ncbi:MAG: HNH endonuclease family protein [Corynebacterium sp.]|nr:HNH endonuclease family protein [Corynebacterium sp.]
MQVLGYNRQGQFGGWATDATTGCTTRELILRDALIEQEMSENECRVQNGWTIDPYTGNRLEVAHGDATDIEIDHIIPLSAAWDLGAYDWDDATRVAFANDPANLLAVSKEANREKADQLPSQWLPPLRNFRCRYVNQMAEVALKYGLSLPQSDLKTMHKQCLLS